MFVIRGCILCGLVAYPLLEGNVSALPIILDDSLVKANQKIPSRADLGKRRDPFTPIKKRRSISSPSQKTPLLPTTIPQTPPLEYPNWKLLGIIQGQYEPLAVIQVSSGERVFVRPGLELGPSGWRIKAISDKEVHLEHASTLTSTKGFSKPKTYILSFPTAGKSS